MKVLSKKQCAATILTMLAVVFLALPAYAGAQESLDPRSTQYGLTSGFSQVSLGQSTGIKSTIANIINIVLGLLGVVAVVIIIAGGFKWMTAGGNEDKVTESRQMIVQGVIGLVIIFAAWAIASFVVTQLGTATGTTG